METLTETTLARILREEGRKQIWLADVTGIGKNQMGLYVRGLHCPPERQQKIAAALGREVDEVFPR